MLVPGNSGCSGQELSKSTGDMIPTIAKSMRDHQEALLHIPGGFVFHYRVSVQQDADNPFFLYHKGLNGLLAVRWPELRSRVDGELRGVTVSQADKIVEIPQQRVSEASFNFETNGGVSVDGNTLGQITNFRSVYSSSFCFPLVFQYFVQVAQTYVRSESLSTDFWLPNAIEQNTYRISDAEEIESIRCIVLERTGFDKIWIAHEKGDVIMKREVRFGEGMNLRQRTLASRLKEITPGIWFPLEQVCEHFDQRSGRLLCRLTLTIDKFEAGHVSDDLITVTIPKNVEIIEDFIGRKVIAKPTAEKRDEAIIEAGKQSRRNDGLEYSDRSWRSILIRASTAIILVIVISIILVIVIWMSVRRRH
jgi:hypothetical protein